MDPAEILLGVVEKPVWTALNKILERTLQISKLVGSNLMNENVTYSDQYISSARLVALKTNHFHRYFRIN